MNVFYFVTLLCFLFWILKNTFFWVALWQEKEYRWYRLSVHLKETAQGKNLFFSKINILKWVIFLLFPIFIFFKKDLNLYQYLIGTFYIIQAFYVLYFVFKRQIKRPVFTLKAVFLIIIIFSFTFFLLLYYLYNSFFGFIFLDKIFAIIVVIFIFLLNFVTKIYRLFVIKKASEKIKNCKNLLVIAISGSYGKSSTKEYIAQILSKKFSVVKTKNSINTPIGIAKTILREVKNETQIFVVEMGTDKKGDNQAICEIIKPNISITTSVSDQHLSTFKTMEDVFETEMELIKNLSKSGTAFFNAENEGSVNLYNKVKNKKILYGVYNKNKNLDIAADKIITNTDGISFEVYFKNEKFKLNSFLLGAHVVENILPAVYLALDLGVEISVIKKAVEELTNPKSTMQKNVSKEGLVIIDDTFNASPESVFAALSYIALFKTKKFFVLSPLIELGEHAKDRHYQIGLDASNKCDYLFLTNNNFSRELKMGIAKGNGNCKMIIDIPKSIADQIKKQAKKGDVAVFEGKQSLVAMKEIL